MSLSCWRLSPAFQRCSVFVAVVLTVCMVAETVGAVSGLDCVSTAEGVQMPGFQHSSEPKFTLEVDFNGDFLPDLLMYGSENRAARFAINTGELIDGTKVPRWTDTESCGDPNNHDTITGDRRVFGLELLPNYGIAPYSFVFARVDGIMLIQYQGWDEDASRPRWNSVAPYLWLGDAGPAAESAKVPRLISVIDLDADSFLDVVVGWKNGTSSGTISYFPGTATPGVFAPEQSLVPLIGDVQESIYAWADFDSNGRLDLVFALDDPGSDDGLYVAMNPGSAPTSVLRVFDTGSMIVLLDTHDWSGDGKPDLLFRVNSPDPSLVLYTNDGTGTLALDRVIDELDTPHTAPRGGADVVDFDGDGFLDILMLFNNSPAPSISNQDIRFIRYLGNGKFAPVALIPQMPDIAGMQLLNAVDVDHDCVPDIVMANEDDASTVFVIKAADTAKCPQRDGCTTGSDWPLFAVILVIALPAILLLVGAAALYAKSRRERDAAVADAFSTEKGNSWAQGSEPSMELSSTLKSDVSGESGESAAKRRSGRSGSTPAVVRGGNPVHVPESATYSTINIRSFNQDDDLKSIATTTSSMAPAFD